MTLQEREQRKQTVDEYGSLEAELAPIKAKLKRSQELAKVIRSWHAEADPDTTQVSAGNHYEIVLGPREVETHLAPMEEIFKALKKANFLEACSMTVKALQNAADPATFLKLTHKERTGTRSMVVARAASKAKAA